MGNCKSADDDDENEHKAGKNFDEWLHRRLQKYFEDIETLVLDIRTSQKEKKEITEAVEEMVVDVLKEVERIDKRFQVKKSGMIRVGNFYENTETICIDEIEVYVVLENLSGETIIQVENTTIDYFETIQVNVNDKFIPKWEDCLAESSDAPARLSGDKLALRFYDYMYNAVVNLRAKSRDIVEKEYGCLELMEDNGISRRGCSVCLKVGWNSSLFISIIITPVLKLNKIQPYVLRQECLSEMVFDAAMKCGSVLLVPETQSSDGNYFRLSFAHTGRFIMTECVSESHRRVYRILHFLVNGYKKKSTSDKQLFTKGEIKNLLITHDMRCGKENAIGECTMTIIDTMLQILTDNKAQSDTIFIPSIFVDHMNILRRSLVNKGKKMTSVNSEAVSKVKEHLVNDVVRAPMYGFSHAISKFVPVNQYILDSDYHDMKKTKEV